MIYTCKYFLREMSSQKPAYHWAMLVTPCKRKADEAEELQRRLECRKGIRLGQRALRPVPIAGSLADKAAEIIHGIQQYYTYTNAS